jgi:hypothetical protein
MNKNLAVTANSLKHADLTEMIIGAFYDVYHELGHASSSPSIGKR